LDAEEVGCPGWIGGGVVGELFDLDLDLSGVAFEGFAVVAGAAGEVSAGVRGDGLRGRRGPTSLLGRCGSCPIDPRSWS